MCPQSHSTVVTTVVHKMRDGQVFKVLTYLPHTLGAWQLSFSSKMFAHWTQYHHTFPWTDERRANGVVNPLNSLFPTPTLTLRIFITCLSEIQLKSVDFSAINGNSGYPKSSLPPNFEKLETWNKCCFVGMHTRWGKGYNELHDICLFRKSPKCLLANDRSTVGKSEEKSRHLLNLFDIAKNQGISLQNFVPKHMAGL